MQSQRCSILIHSFVLQIILLNRLALPGKMNPSLNLSHSVSLSLDSNNTKTFPNSIYRMKKNIIAELLLRNFHFFKRKVSLRKLLVILRFVWTIFTRSEYAWMFFVSDTKLLHANWLNKIFSKLYAEAGKGVCLQFASIVAIWIKQLLIWNSNGRKVSGNFCCWDKVELELLF